MPRATCIVLVSTQSPCYPDIDSSPPSGLCSPNLPNGDRDLQPGIVRGDTRRASVFFIVASFATFALWRAGGGASARRFPLTPVLQTSSVRHPYEICNSVVAVNFTVRGNCDGNSAHPRFQRRYRQRNHPALQCSRSARIPWGRESVCSVDYITNCRL